MWPVLSPGGVLIVPCNKDEQRGPRTGLWRAVTLKGECERGSEVSVLWKSQEGRLSEAGATAQLGYMLAVVEKTRRMVSRSGQILGIKTSAGLVEWRGWAPAAGVKERGEGEEQL